MESNALLGTWKMISWTREIVATGEIADVMGADPIGYIAYHAGGRMMATVFRRERSKPLAAALTDQEKIGLFDTMLAYCAAYTLEDGKVIHHVEGAWNPIWETDLIRPFTLEVDELLISDAPGTDPITGQAVIFRLRFRKV